MTSASTVACGLRVFTLCGPRKGYGAPAYWHDIEFPIIPSPDPSGLEILRISTQIAQSQGVPSRFHVEVTVLRVHHVPSIAKRFRLKNQFFVTVTVRVTTKIASISIEGQTVQWNQEFDAL
ncbi:hypothetical protein BJY52DRAFT_1221801 [Lactarius psammicola]|nr:hypothetical protein BJY52DRAFT_1221801 [Lactarius psammicola]